MVETTLNLFDVVVVLVMFLSGLLAFFRGFVREVLSLGAWVGAGLITLYYFPDVQAWLEPQIKSEEPPDAKGKLGVMVVAFIGTYLVSLITFFVINRFLIKIMKTNKDIGMLDNGLGLFFGFFRGALLLSLGYFILSFVFPEDNLPPWLANSETRPYVAKGAAMLADVAPEYLGSIPSLEPQPLEPQRDDSMFEQDLLNQMLRSGTPPPEGQAAPDVPAPEYEYLRTDEFQQLMEQLGRQQNDAPQGNR